MTEFLFSLHINLIHLYKSQRILNNTDVEINEVVDNKTKQIKIR